MIPVYVISLERSEARRMFMRHQLNGLGIDFTFFDAVDGSKLTPAALLASAPGGGINYCGLMTPGEIGAALSHMSVIRNAAESNHDFVAVIEDDVLVTADARMFLDEGLLRSLPPFHILQMAGPSKKSRLALKIGNTNGHQIYTSPGRSFSMAGLIYTREAARMIGASIGVITSPIDNMIFHDHAPFGLRVMEIRPSVVQHDEEALSDIGARSRPQGFSNIISREFRRIRNRTKLWCSFMSIWGLRGLLGLRKISQ